MRSGSSVISSLRVNPSPGEFPFFVAMTTTTLSAIAFAFVVPIACASTFLQSRDLHEVTRDMIKRTLVAELGMDTARTRMFEDEMRPMFAALPKNRHGTLEPTTVRYALHRYFVNKHGWYIKGLEPLGQAWNSTSVSSVMMKKVPAYIESLFDERLHGQGMGLHELAAFAATLLDFVHNAAVSDLMGLYKALNVETTTPVRKEEADRLIRAYVLQTLDGNRTIDSVFDMAGFEQDMVETFPDWDDFLSWVEDVRHTKSFEHSMRSLVPQEFTLETVVEDVQALNDHLGAFQDIGCRSLKAALADVEYQNSGRVLLSDFYRIGLEGKYLFIEYTDYLRKLGALDETDPSHPTVIIANYLAGPANCMITTNFHSVCCYDECEHLFSRVEREVAVPHAEPGSIAKIVADMPSDTVDAPRNLSTSLLSRLQEIADHHDGVVPLHGRLFAQWLHHAYPMECSYPHAAGTTSPSTPDEWLDETGHDETAAPQDHRLHISRAAKPSGNKTEAALPWEAVEELVVPRRAPKPKSSFSFRKVAAFGGIVALAAGIIRVVGTTATRCDGKAAKEKFLV